MSDCDQKEEHVSCWPDDNDVFFELNSYTRRYILVLFHRNNSPQNPCLKSDTLYWLQVNQSLFFFFIWSFVLSRHFFVCLYLYCHCRSNYQEGGGDPILQFTADTIVCQSQARNWISIDICCGLFFQSFEMRCSCLFCWYICTCKSSVLVIIYFPYIYIYLAVNFIYTNVPDGSGDLLISVWN